MLPTFFLFLEGRSSPEFKDKSKNKLNPSLTRHSMTMPFGKSEEEDVAGDKFPKRGVICSLPSPHKSHGQVAISKTGNTTRSFSKYAGQRCKSDLWRPRQTW